MFFVSGVTGKVGGAVAHRLLEEGKTVRTLARDPQRAAAWEEKGVDVRKGDWNDAAALAAAFGGVEGALVMMPPLLAPSPGYPEAKAVIASYQEALRHAPPPRLVLLSSFGSQQKRGLGNITSTHLMEEALGDLPIPTAVVRPGSFLENYAFSLDRANSTGVFDTFFQPTERPVAMVATADIGREIAELLVSGWSGKKIVEIGTYRSADELAEAMGEVLGRSVQARSIPREQWSYVLQAMGLQPEQTGPYEEMQESLNSGWIDFGVPGAELVPGTTTPAQVFEQARRG